jgi:hypothetical protein
MNASQAWLIYILVVLVIYLILTIADKTLNISNLTRLLIGFIIGAFVILIIAPGIVSTSPDDRVWYSLLILVAFIVPIVLFLWMLWTQRINLTTLRDKVAAGSPDSVQVEENLTCDTNGENCRVTRRTETKGSTRSVKTYEASPRSPRVSKTTK